jgi:hypothetical protein
MEQQPTTVVFILSLLSELFNRFLFTDINIHGLNSSFSEQEVHGQQLLFELGDFEPKMSVFCFKKRSPLSDLK